MWYALPRSGPGLCPLSSAMTLSCPPLQAPLPDTYRGLYREDHPSPAVAYASEVEHVVSSAQAQGRKVTTSVPLCHLPLS